MIVAADEKGPKTGKYIGVWILTTMVSGFFIYVFGIVLALLMIDASNPTIGSYWVIMPLVRWGIWAIIFIGIYSYFSDLIVSKVIPWALILGSLGVLRNIFTINDGFSEFDLTIPPITIISSVVGFILAIFCISSYFKSKEVQHSYSSRFVGENHRNGNESEISVGKVSRQVGTIKNYKGYRISRGEEGGVVVGEKVFDNVLIAESWINEDIKMTSQNVSTTNDIKPVEVSDLSAPTRVESATENKDSYLKKVITLHREGQLSDLALLEIIKMQAKDNFY